MFVGLGEGGEAHGEGERRGGCCSRRATFCIAEIGSVIDAGGPHLNQKVRLCV